MRAIIFCFVFVLVAICCSNGAPVDAQPSVNAVSAKASAQISKRAHIDPYSTIKSYIQPHHKKRRRYHKRHHKVSKRHHRHRFIYPIRDRLQYYSKRDRAIASSGNSRNLTDVGDHGDFEVNNGEVFEHGAVPDLRRSSTLKPNTNSLPIEDASGGKVSGRFDDQLLQDLLHYIVSMSHSTASTESRPQTSTRDQTHFEENKDGKLNDIVKLYKNFFVHNPSEEVYKKSMEHADSNNEDIASSGLEIDDNSLVSSSSQDIVDNSLLSPQQEDTSLLDYPPNFSENMYGNHEMNTDEGISGKTISRNKTKRKTKRIKHLDGVDKDNSEDVTGKNNNILTVSDVDLTHTALHNSTACCRQLIESSKNNGGKEDSTSEEKSRDEDYPISDETVKYMNEITNHGKHKTGRHYHIPYLSRNNTGTEIPEPGHSIVHQSPLIDGNSGDITAHTFPQQVGGNTGMFMMTKLSATANIGIPELSIQNDFDKMSGIGDIISKNIGDLDYKQLVKEEGGQTSLLSRHPPLHTNYQLDQKAPLARNDPFGRISPLLQNIPFGQNVPLNQNIPFGQNVPLNQNNPFGQNVPLNQNNHFDQNVPLNQNIPFGPNVPLNQNIPFGQNVPLHQNIPLGQNSHLLQLGQNVPLNQNIPLGQNVPLNQNIPLGQTSHLLQNDQNNPFDENYSVNQLLSDNDPLSQGFDKHGDKDVHDSTNILFQQNNLDEGPINYIPSLRAGQPSRFFPKTGKKDAIEGNTNVHEKQHNKRKNVNQQV